MSIISKRKKWKIYRRIAREALFRFFGRKSKRTQEFVRGEYGESWSTVAGCLPPQHYKASVMWLGNELVIRRGIDYLTYSIKELRRAANALQPREVVELGSGDGFILTALASACPGIKSLKGIDLTEEGVRVAKHNLAHPLWKELSYVTGENQEIIPSRLHGRNIEFIQGDMLNLALPDESCDLVFSRVAMEQIPRDYPRAFKEARRITRSYAIFIEEFREAQRNAFQRMHLKNSDYFMAPLSALQDAGFEIIRYEKMKLNKIKFSLGFVLCKVRK